MKEAISMLLPIYMTRTMEIEIGYTWEKQVIEYMVISVIITSSS
jgi:hypothetical protein